MLFTIPSSVFRKFTMPRVMFVCQRSAKRRFMSAVDLKQSPPATYLVGLAAAGALVYFSPIFPQTKEGLREAFSNKRRQEPAPWWNWIFGGLGFVAGFGGTMAYVSRIGSHYPVLGGFKTPWALFGALISGQLCNQLTPILFDASGVVTRAVSYGTDGLIADTVGRPEGQIAAWHRPTAWERMLGIAVTREDDFNEDDVLSSRPQISPESGAKVSDQDQSLLKMARRLVELRQRQAALQSNEGHRLLLSSDLKRLQELQAPELAAIEKEKKALKEAAERVHHVRLSRHIAAEVNKAADHLTQLRLRQLVLAKELSLGARGARRAEVVEELQKLDKEKDLMKRSAYRTFGTPIARVARSVPSWRSVLKNANNQQ